MKKSSQKPTEHVKAERKNTATPKNSSWTIREMAESRFHGMSKDLERIPPLHIPGYKTRG